MKKLTIMEEFIKIHILPSLSGWQANFEAIKTIISLSEVCQVLE